ncbi:DUF6801 domain-containing protein [Jatrophihabitans sp. GAS493]|uniref:DUF6801 domain-containing protein n=1 Tax=Jatrophihabitans sp. GAS493 TaxID=1907575 RepID=UPI000BB8539F|nr:DUF6801 domain-containing protein [Jatrophihabitans sp. GAS493]
MGLAAGAFAMLNAGGSPAAAATIDATVPTTCTIPVAGAESYDAKISATIPDRAVVGDTVQLLNFSISIVLNVATTDALQILGATTLEGSITAGATLTNASPSDLSIVATVPVTPVPQTQDENGDGPEFTITATGPSPTATLTSAGTAVLTATTVNAVFNPKNAAGTSVLPAAKQIIPCKFNAGDNLVLASIPVSSNTVHDPTPTTAPPTPVLDFPTPTPVPPTPRGTPIPVNQHVVLSGPTSAAAEATPFTYTATAQLPVGHISFYDGTTLLGTSTAPNGISTTFTGTFYLNSGTHNLIATTESWNGLDYGGRDNVSNTLTVVIASVLPTPQPTPVPPTPTPVGDLAPYSVSVQLIGPSTVELGSPATYTATALYTSGPRSGQPLGTSITYVDDATGATLCYTSGSCAVTFPTVGVTHHVHADVANTFTCCVSSGDPGHGPATSNIVDTRVVPVATPSPTPAPNLTHIDFSATGTIGLPTVNGTGKVGPGTISTDVNLKGGSFTGTSSIPDITVNASLFGFIPTTIVSSFTQVGLLTGQLAAGATDVTADLKANLGVKSVKALGVLPLTSGNCTTASPVSIHLASNGKGEFSPFTGGTLSSKFAIGKLANCGALTDLLNAIFPGNANTLTLKLATKG